jgi:hypothetical protein
MIILLSSHSPKTFAFALFCILLFIVSPALTCAQNSLAVFYITGSSPHLQESIEIKQNNRKLESLMPGEACYSILEDRKNIFHFQRLGFDSKSVELLAQSDSLYFFEIRIKGTRWSIQSKDQSAVSNSLLQYATSIKLENDLMTNTKEDNFIFFGEIPPEESKILVALNDVESIRAEANFLCTLFESTKLKNCVLVERDAIDLILEEQKLSLSALFSNEAIEIGNLHSAEFICLIEVRASTEIGKFFFSARIIKITSGEIIYTYSDFGTLDNLIDQLAN